MLQGKSAVPLLALLLILSTCLAAGNSFLEQVKDYEVVGKKRRSCALRTHTQKDLVYRSRMFFLNHSLDSGPSYRLCRHWRASQPVGE